MKYRKKPIVVDVFEWTEDRDITKAPDWLIEAFWEGRIFYEDGFSGCGVRKASVYTIRGKKTLVPSDYIIHYENGYLDVCNSIEFALTFEKEHELIE